MEGQSSGGEQERLSVSDPVHGWEGRQERWTDSLRSRPRPPAQQSTEAFPPARPCAPAGAGWRRGDGVTVVMRWEAHPGKPKGVFARHHTHTITGDRQLPLGQVQPHPTSHTCWAWGTLRHRARLSGSGSKAGVEILPRSLQASHGPQAVEQDLGAPHSRGLTPLCPGLPPAPSSTLTGSPA